MRITAQEAYRRGWPVIVKQTKPVLIPMQTVFPSPIVKKRRALNTRLAELLPVAALAADVSRAEILGDRRHKPIVAARKAIYLVMSRERGMTLVERLNSRAWEHRQHRQLREEAARRISELEAALHPFTFPGLAGSRLFRSDGTQWTYVDLTIAVADINRARKALGIID